MYNSLVAQIIIGLLVGVTGLVWLASKLRVPYPILLVLGGLGIAFAPLPPVPLRPDLIFPLFLPPLLYHAALLTSWRDFRANLKPILLLAIGLVLLTTVSIAWVSHSFLGMVWPAAFALGAIISPPDAVAATSIMQRLRLPKRIVTILEGESLVNDATALVIYLLAIAAAFKGEFSLSQASWQFLYVSAGGIAIGYVVGVVMSEARRRLKDNSVDTLVSLLVPYIAYLPAEWLHVSGVLAAVTSGLYVGRQLPRIIASEQRMRLYPTWEALVFLLNGFVFILIGLQLPSIIANIRADPSITLTQLCWYTVAIAAVTIGVRFAVVFLLSLLRERIDRHVTDRHATLSFRWLLIISWSGMRGIVSLAAAIALPLSPERFPHRDPIIFITFGMILITLVGQGLTLPMLIKRLRFEADDHDEREEALARRELAFAALGRLEAMELIGEAPKPLIDEVREGYELRVQRFNQRLHEADQLEAVDPCNSRIDVELEALESERQVLIKLRDDGLIADEILRHIQHELDIAEVRLQAQKQRTQSATLV